jgi:hypothetical protein
VRLSIVNKKLKFQKPDFKESISHIAPIKYTRLTPTNVTAPRYFDIKIVNRERGFESIRSIVPLSTIEGMKEADDIIQKISTRRYDTDVIII